MRYSSAAKAALHRAGYDPAITVLLGGDIAEDCPHNRVDNGIAWPGTPLMGRRCIDCGGLAYPDTQGA